MAISDGELIIRDPDKQTQDINELSHDTENAHSKLKPIFNKENEQTKQNIVTSLQELASQVKELERTIHKDAGKDSKDGKMGNDFSKGVDSAVAIITGIITGDIAGGLAGASAPWLAKQIKIQAGDNETARLVAHAILGAVVAELQGNSGLAGGAGAVVGEIAADIIRKQLYGKEVKDLTEEEKETISALSQLASGLAVAAGGGNIGDASAAISSSKNAVENNEENLVFDFFFTESKMIAQYNCYTDDVCNNLDDNAREHAILEQSAEIQKEIIEPYKEAGELLANIENTLLDFTPIIGDAKAFAEAEDVIDYTIASVGLIPGVGDAVVQLLKEAKAALKVGDTKKASNAAGKGNGAATQSNNKYSGGLVKVNKPDAAADALAQRIGGESRVRFANDGREFDCISDMYIAQTKPALQQLNKSVRDQMKATFEAAKDTNRSVYYHFEGQPSQSVINKLNEYSNRYGVKVVIDTKPLNPK